MKPNSCLAVATASFFAVAPGIGLAQEAPSSFIYESAREFFSGGDFDGDGRGDLVIVDKETGKYRLGYASASGVFTWVDCRPSGLKGIGGFNVGKFFNPKLDALVFTSADANQLSLVEAGSPTSPPKPMVVAFSAALGPNLVVPVDIGGTGNTPLADLYVGSIYNSPDANQGTLLRNDGAEFPKVADVALPGAATHGNLLALKSGQPQWVCTLLNEDKGDTLRVEDMSGGKPVLVASVAGLPAGSDYAIGNFAGSAFRQFVFYKPGEKSLIVRPVEEAGGKIAFGPGAVFEMAQPVRRVVTLAGAGAQKLLVIFGEGESAGLFGFDGVKAPVLTQTLTATNSIFTCAASTPKGAVVFSQPTGGKFSTKYQLFAAEGDKLTPGVYGSLASLADNDNITIPDIHARIVSKLKETDSAQMKLYTNTIPGTRVTYVMVPIPAGEFSMGSPEAEPDRKPDEGPQHKVKIEPFWMGQFEVTWNEYELFMYPDEEKRTRAIVPTDAAGDKLADAVTHPSRPYVEMSFGMGKDGYPAISMTQHAANKYCQWLSAKTGQFYRLPTEAEWEYACRAGTTTTYFWGTEASKLPEYAWFEQNSDFKYQKVGKKKANPWGLHDIYGNVVEWVLDQYDPDFYKVCGDKGTVLEPWNKATKSYPHAVRGGSWDDEAKMLRSAARRGSERAWKMQDPQLPKSIWYFSDAQWVGFRVVRPLKVPAPEEMQKYWTSGTERD